MSGFALMAMVELQLPVGRNNDPLGKYDNSPVIVAFAVVTALLVAVYLFALMVRALFFIYK